MSDSPTILAIETSTNACSVAISVGKELVAEKVEIGQSIHSRQLLNMVDKSMSAAGINREALDVIAVSKGPGSFTGLRIGIGVAQGMAFSLGLPMVSVDSLKCVIDPGAVQSSCVLSAIDARMSEVYWAVYRCHDETVELVGDIQLSAPNEISLQRYCDEFDQADLAKAMSVGNAWEIYSGELEGGVSSLVQKSEWLYPQAKNLLRFAHRDFLLGLVQDPASFEPLYVRNDVAKKSNKSLIQAR